MAVEQRTSSSSSRTSQDMLSWWLKFGLVLYKHFLIRRYHYVLTFCELLLPILVMLFMVFLSVFVEKGAKISPAVYPLEDPMRGQNNINLEVFYIPDVSYTRDFVKYFKEQLRRTPGSSNRHVNFHGLKSEKDYDAGKWPKVKPDVVLIFDGMSPNTTLPNVVKCRFILNYESLPLLELDVMTIQHVIALHFMQKVEGYDVSQNVTFSLLRLPELPNDPHGEHIVGHAFIYFGILLPIAFMLIIPALLTQIVMEKENGIKELLRLMGLPGQIQWLGFTVNTFVILLINSIFVILMMTHNIFSKTDTIIQKTSEGPLLLLFILYILSSISFCFFLSALCSRATRATVFGFVVWFISVCIPFVLTDAKSVGGLNTFNQLLWSLLPNMALFWSLRFIGFLEYTTGLEGRHYFHRATIAEDMCLFPLIFMFLLDFALYWFFAWYLDQVFPGDYGVPRHWYFLCTHSYYKSQRKKAIMDDGSDRQQDSGPSGEGGRHVNIFQQTFEAYVDPILYKMKIKTLPLATKTYRPHAANFEAEPTDLPKIVVAENLKKVFKAFFSPPIVAVHQVNLTVYKGQIFVLLGENGAGKTVTMSMLAGVRAIYKDVEYDFELVSLLNFSAGMLAFARSPNPVCVTELFVAPSANNHIKVLFARNLIIRLKGLRRSLLTGEVNFLLQRLKLWEYRKKRAKQLPGGMQRRMQLGLAVIGRVQVIILDEPTSGMDPEARRIVWDLLLEMREKCCIVISTNYMEEADALGDRIAIMSHGTILCSGSPMFLRSRFGANYILKVTKSTGCKANQVLELIQRHIPGAYIDTNTNTEVGIVLPVDHKSNFPDLFRDLEARLELLNISNFGLSTMALEEVFVKVNEMAEHKFRKRKTSHPQPDHSTIRGHPSAPEPLMTTETRLEMTEGNERLRQQFRGLMMKRAYYMYNRPFFFFWQFTFVFATTIIVVLLINKVEDKKEVTTWFEEVFNPRKNLVVLLHYDTTKFCLPDSYTNNIPESVTVKYLHPVSDLSEEILEIASEDPIAYNHGHYIMGASFATGKDDTLDVVATYYMSKSPKKLSSFSKMSSLNLIHNALLQNCHKEERKITINVNITKIQTPVEERLEETGRPTLSSITYKWLAATFLALGFCLTASACIYLVAQERITGAKHMQYMTGTTIVVFWATAFVFDYLYYLVCSLFCIIVVVAFSGSIINMPDVTGIMFLAMLLFGWCVIPFAYFVSFFTKSAAGAYITILVIHVVSVLIGVALQTLWLHYDMGDFSSFVDALFVMLEVLPGCSFVSIFLKLWTTGMMLTGDKFDPMTMKNEGVGRQLLIMTVSGLGYGMIVLLLEQRTSKCVNLMVAFLTKTLSDTAFPDMEPDVEAEDKRVKDKLYQQYHQNLASLAVPSDISLASLGPTDVLLVDSLTKRFSAKFTAVDHLTFGVRSDECFGLLGVNGAGKTTTFRMLTGSLLISLGNAYLDDTSLLDDRSKFLSQVGYCPQLDALVDHLTSRETLVLFARLRGVREEQVGPLADAYLTKFGLGNYAYTIAANYSIGTKRKLSVALAFLGSPILVLLDEPTTGVDPLSRRKIWEVILSSKVNGTAVVLSSHSMDECEVLCSRIAILKRGQFKCLGAVQYLKNKFGKVFKVTIKLSKTHDVEEKIRHHDDTVRFMEENFKNCTMHEADHECLLVYSVPYTSADWHKLFTTMEEAKEKFKWEDYSVCQATLEEVFLAFASDVEKEETVTLDSEFF